MLVLLGQFGVIRESNYSGGGQFGVIRAVNTLKEDNSMLSAKVITLKEANKMLVEADNTPFINDAERDICQVQ